MPGSPGYRPTYRGLYKTAAWRQLRRQQLQREPLCFMCARVGLLTGAEIVDHIRPHRGNRSLFFDPANLQSLCKRHHDQTKQSWEKRDTPEVGTDGWPIADGS